MDRWSTLLLDGDDQLGYSYKLKLVFVSVFHCAAMSYLILGEKNIYLI